MENFVYLALALALIALGAFIEHARANGWPKFSVMAHPKPEKKRVRKKRASKPAAPGAAPAKRGRPSKKTEGEQPT